MFKCWYFGNNITTFWSNGGPIATAFFAFVYKNETYFIINILILIFNLIPIYPLDGGRILKCFFVLLLGYENGIKTNRIISYILIILMTIFSIFLLFKYNNFSLILISLYIFKIYKLEIEKDKIQNIINYLQIN